MHFIFYSTSTNLESEDGNFRIALYNLKKLGKKWLSLADISFLLKDFVSDKCVSKFKKHFKASILTTWKFDDIYLSLL